MLAALARLTCLVLNCWVSFSTTAPESLLRLVLLFMVLVCWILLREGCWHKIYYGQLQLMSPQIRYIYIKG